MKTKILRFGESRRPPFRFWYETVEGRQTTDEKALERIHLKIEPTGQIFRNDDENDFIYDLLNPIEIRL